MRDLTPAGSGSGLFVFMHVAHRIGHLHGQLAKHLLVHCVEG